MKLTFLFMLSGLIAVSASTYSQSTRLDIKVKDNSIVELFKEIEENSEFYFFYQKEELAELENISVNKKGAKVTEILDEALEGSDLEYKIVDRYIVIRKDGKGLDEVESALAQQKSISGSVKDEQGELLPGVTVLIKGTTQGTVTDLDGKYSISNIPDNATLVFSFVGMLSQEIVVGTQATIDLTMRADAIGLEEVIAIGYGTQKKSDLTGAVGTISTDKLQGQPVANINEAIHGKLPGVQVSSTSGEPGSKMQIRIRGAGTFGSSGPLYVVDGMPVDVADVNAINPNAIASMNILKDASASAIYGSRAANGVVIITTKSGSTGEAKLTYQGYYGIQNFNDFIPMLNTRQYADLNIEASENAGLEPEAAWTNPETFKTDIDWQDAAYNPAPIQDHTFMVSGGSEGAKYSVSAGYFDQEGIMVFNSLKRYSTRAKSEFKIGKKLTVGQSINLSRQIGLNQGHGNNLDFTYLLGASPSMPIYREENFGGYAGPSAAYTGRNNRDNIVARRDMRRSNSYNNKMLLSAFLEYEILPDLKYRLNGGVNAGFSTHKNYTPKYYAENRSNHTRSLNEGKNESWNYLLENLLTYSKTFDDFSVTLLGGYTEQSSWSSTLRGTINKFPSNDVRVIDAGTGNERVYGNEAEWAMRSFLSRLNLTYKDRYLLTATFRRDGSSRFGSESQYGNFPSFAGGWNVTRETFMSDVDFISQLKLRGSWGQLGNQEIPNYVNQHTISTNLLYVLGANQNTVASSAVTGLGNPYLAWEATTQTNIGVDLGFLNNALSINADYWIKDTDDVLLRLPISSATGLSSSPYQNAAGIKNSGFEFQVGYRQTTKEFKYELSANIATLKNEITSLGDGSTIINYPRNAYHYGVYTRTAVGESMSSFYGYETDGIFQNQAEVDAHATQSGAKPGDIRFIDQLTVDTNGDGIMDAVDGVITSEDRTVIGDPFPDFTYGFNGNASYKNFDVSFSFDGAAGKDLYNSQRAFLEGMDGQHGQMATTLERWTGEGTSFTMPRAVRGDPNGNGRPSTRYVEDASYLKLRNLQIGYNLSQKAADFMRISNARLYVSAQNVFTITDYTGYNPDILGGAGWASSNLNPLSVGVDTGTYPMPRTIQLGVQVGF